MVKVIDGEIVQDDDPRLKQRGGASSSAPPAGTSHGGAASPAGQPAAGASRAAAPLFNWDAPAFRALPAAQGGSLMGLPAVAIYGLEVDPVHYCALAAATAFVGLRGFIGVGCLLVILYVKRGPTAGGQQPQQAGGSQTTRLRPRGAGDSSATTSRSTAGGQGQHSGGGSLQGSLERFMTQPPPGREYRGHPTAGAQQGPGPGSQGSGSGAFSGTGRKLGGN